MRFLKYILILLIILFSKNIFLYILIWGIIEIIIQSIKEKSINKTQKFICNFVLTILNCIDIIFNIILQVPANRILLTTTDSKTVFGNPKNSFTEVLRINFVYNNLKQRGIILYKIISYFKNTSTK